MSALHVQNYFPTYSFPIVSEYSVQITTSKWVATFVISRTSPLDWTRHAETSVQSSWAVEYTDFISAEGKDSRPSVL